MEMEKTSGRKESHCPPSPGHYPWLVNVQDAENTDQMFCNIKPSLVEVSLSIQNHRIPEFCGKLPIAYCHGWLVLCPISFCHDYVLWNPITLESIHLPSLALKLRSKNQDFVIDDCCLTSPPNNPDSMLVLFRHGVTSIFFCPLRDKRWTQMSYARQIKDVGTLEWEFVKRPVYCKGKLYAYTTNSRQLVSIDIVKPNNGLVIKPLFCRLPSDPFSGLNLEFLVESCGELLTIFIKYRENLRFILATCIFKLDFTTMTWVKVENTKDRVFFLDERHFYNFSCRALDSSDGSYLHIISDEDTGIYSYNMEDKTMFWSSPFGSESQCNLWMLQNRDDHGEDIRTNDIPEDDGQKKEIVTRSIEDFSIGLRNVDGNVKASKLPCLLDLPFDILERIANFYVPIECLNFRATSKLCRSVVPSIPWKTDSTRLQTCPLISPWLVFSDKDNGIMVFIDPKLGDRYYITFPDNIGDAMICSSKFGWLLIAKDRKSLLFFNPFTMSSVDIPELLPDFFVSLVNGYGFSSPPSSSDCILVAFAIPTMRQIHLTSPGLLAWRRIDVAFDIPYEPCFSNSPVYHGRDFFLLDQGGKLGVFKSGPDRRWEILVADSPISRDSFQECFLVECDDNLLSIWIGYEVEVLKLNETTLVWEEVKSLGRHMIFVSPSVSFSALARYPRMENKIYFPRYSGFNILFYSLDACKYGSFGFEEEPLIDVYNTREQLLCGWIEPSWGSSGGLVSAPSFVH